MIVSTVIISAVIVEASLGPPKNSRKIAAPNKTQNASARKRTPNKIRENREKREILREKYAKNTRGAPLGESALRLLLQTQTAVPIHIHLMEAGVAQLAERLTCN